MKALKLNFPEMGNNDICKDCLPRLACRELLIGHAARVLGQMWRESSFGVKAAYKVQFKESSLLWDVTNAPQAQGRRVRS